MPSSALTRAAAALSRASWWTTAAGIGSPLTGKFSALGSEDKKAVDLAVEQLNAAGGLLGKKVEVITPPTPTKKEKPAATPPPPPTLVLVDEWDKVLSAMSIILAAGEDHIIATLNGRDDEKRKAARALFRSTAARLTTLRNGVNP